MKPADFDALAGQIAAAARGKLSPDEWDALAALLRGDERPPMVKTTVRMPAELHRRVKTEAARLGTNVQDMAAEALTLMLDARRGKVSP